MNQQKKISKLISLTFDENPEIRIKAAEELAKSDDPAAAFALIELSYDKDAKVQQKVREILEKMKVKNKEEISFYELFNKKDDKKEKTEEKDKNKKVKILEPINELFIKKLGKEKGEKIKQKMMPTIEKIYEKAIKDDNKIKNILVPYIEAISNIEIEKNKEEDIGVDLDTIDGVNLDNLDKIEEEIEELDETKEIDEKINTIKNEEVKTIFRKAYDLMMLSDGDEKIMEKQSKYLISQMEKEIKLAFKLAKNKFKANTITHLTELKDGMRNITTDILFVKSVQNKEYLKTKKKKGEFTRIVVADKDGSEGIIYLLNGRGKIVKPGMKLKVVKGMVKTFKFTGETALTITKRRGNVYIVL